MVRDVPRNVCAKMEEIAATLMEAVLPPRLDGMKMNASFYLPNSQIATAKHLWTVCRDNAKWPEILKAKIGARK